MGHKYQPVIRQCCNQRTLDHQALWTLGKHHSGSVSRNGLGLVLADSVRFGSGAAPTGYSFGAGSVQVRY